MVDMVAVAKAVVKLMRMRQEASGVVTSPVHSGECGGHFPQAQGARFEMAPCAIQPWQGTAESRDRDIGNAHEGGNIIYYGKDIIQPRFDGAMSVQIPIRAEREAAILHSEQRVGVGRETPGAEGDGTAPCEFRKSVPPGGDQAGLFPAGVAPQDAVGIEDAGQGGHFRVDMELEVHAGRQDPVARVREIRLGPSRRAGGFDEERALQSRRLQRGEQIIQPQPARMDVPFVVAVGGFDVDGEKNMHGNTLHGEGGRCTAEVGLRHGGDRE